MPWQYDPGENWQDKKHGWNRPYAGVKTVLGRRVGCCPNGISVDRAAALLNGGLSYFEEEGLGAAPDRIYAVDQGVPYESRPTLRGVSYHGFPVLPEKYAKLPARVRAWLREHGLNEGWLEQWKP